MGKSSTPPQQTTVSKAELPEWVQQAAQANIAQAQNVSQNLMTPYTGQRVAPLDPSQAQAIQNIQGAAGMSQPAYNLAQLGTLNQMNYTPQNVQAASIARNMPQFMNPYISGVVNPTLNILDQQRQQAISGIGANAAQSNAFGGSRQGISEGVTNAQYGMQGAQLAGNLYSGGYNTALGAAQNQAQLQQAAALANQQAGLTGQQLNLNAANQLGQLGSQAQQSYMAGQSAALGAGQQLQQQQQQQLAALQQYYQEMQQYPLQQLGINLSALGQTPYGGTTTTTGPANYMPGSPLMGGLGGAAALGGLAAMVPGAGLPLILAGAGAGGLLGGLGTPHA